MKRTVMRCNLRKNLKYKRHISKFNRRLNVFLVNDFIEKFSSLFTRSFIKSAIRFFFVVFFFVLVFLNNMFSRFFPSTALSFSCLQIFKIKVKCAFIMKRVNSTAGTINFQCHLQFSRCCLIVSVSYFMCTLFF